MSQFPDPIVLPLEVKQAREQRTRYIFRSAVRGIILRGSAIALELTGVWFFGSAALLLDALASLIDIAFTVLLLLCVKWADKAPDLDHPFGHGRYEPLMGLLLGLMTFLFGAGMLYFQLIELKDSAISHPPFFHPWLWLIPACVVVALEIAARITKSAAKKVDSPALGVEALHYRIDALSSVIAAIALLLSVYAAPASGGWFDHLGAVAIACLMMLLSINAMRKNLHQLTDRVPADKYFNIVRQAAAKVEGVKGIEKVRIQMYGPDAHIGVDIEVDPKLTVEEAHKISQKVRAALQQTWPKVRDAIVHIEPYYPNDH